MKKIRTAIIGFGRSGQDIHGAYFASDKNTQFEVVCVADALDFRRAQAEKKFGCETVSDYRALLDREDIDLVVNASYSHQHAPITVDFLRHGRSVICEKPFGIHAEDSQAMIDAAETSGAMLCVFQQSHFAPYYQRIREIMNSGALGRIAAVKIQFSGFARRWDWQCSQSYGGGCVHNTGPHPMEQALDILDLPDDTVPAVAARLDIVNSFGDAEDFAKILLLAPDKPVIDVEISSCNAYADFTYLVEGSLGTLKATQSSIDYQYYRTETAPAQQLTLESLRGPNGEPRYCGETLEWVKQHEDLTGSAFDHAVQCYYSNIYDHMTAGAPLVIRPSRIKQMIAVMDEIARQNPLPVRY